MAIQDISWGAVLAGAGIAIALAASVPIAAAGAAGVAGTTTVIGALTANGAMSSTLAYTATGAVGGIVGEFTSDLFKRTRDACNTLLQK
jgi:hypothetical protein